MSVKEFNFQIPKYFNLATNCIDRWMDNEEISNKMNVPIGTVRSRLHRARETLLRIFNNKKYE